MNDGLINKVAAAALADFDGVMSFLGLSGGKNSGREYMPTNPTRNDRKPGSLSIINPALKYSCYAAYAA